MKTTNNQFTNSKQFLAGLTPSQLVKKQLTGNNILEDIHQKPRIIQFLNLSDFSINTESYVSIDEPLFEPIPPLIQFTDYEPLQIKQKTFKLRNKDRFSRRVKIIQPDSRLFQVLPANDDKSKSDGLQGKKVAAGMQTKFIIRFSPEAKIDYKYELIVVTQRQKFIVPIIAVGKRAMIDFPDILDFGNCPVKYYTEKPVIIRNLGQKTTKWNLELPSGFSTTQKQGVLECGKNEQIIIKFYPTEAKLYKAYAKLEYDKLQAFSEILGTGQLSNVYLSKTFIPMEESYIGLQTQQTLQIINKSNVKVDFQWRAFMSQKQQKPKKELLRQRLIQQQAEELMLLREMVLGDKSAQNEHDFEDSQEQQKDAKIIMVKKQKKAELALNRKYKTIRKAIQDDLFLFQDHIFKIEPQIGQIWPNSQITVTVTFMPTEANHYQCMAYCNISCAQQRLPLKLKGEGIGPKAYLTQQEINFGDVFVNQPIKQTIQIQNRGEIQCHFSLIKQERAFAKMFEFSIEEKNLEVGENASIDIRFKSSIPGQFKQKFKWQLQGSQKNLEMTFLGHVIAPTFEFVDPNDTNRAKPEIIFGKVSYDFEYKQKIILKNTSSVAFTYFLKIQNDGKVSQSEFKIFPHTGTIQQRSEKEIEISFIPKSIKKYETVMTIDIEGVGNDMLSVPIKAECQVPSVEVFPTQKLEFGQAFLNYPETRIVTLKNNSDLKAKFSVLPQSEESKILAKYTVTPESDVINQKDTKEVQVTLVTMKRGQITLPLHINIVGTNNSQPNVLNICATSIGPPVKVTPQELDFGQVEVLKDYSLKVTIVNASKIPAQFHAFTKQKVSIFKPMIKHAILKPEQKLQVQVICNADDSSKFNDILHFVIKDGNDKDIVLKAKGTGSTIYCVQNLEYLNFETIYTYKTVVKEIFIQNKGRKSQKIVWQKRKLLQKKKSKEEEEKTEEDNVFIIEPESETIPPKYGRNFKFIAHSTKKGKINQQFQLTSQVGTQRKSNILKTLTIEGQFIQPSLIYSQKKINFKYKWQKGVQFTPISKTLELTSGSTLPLNFNLKVVPPYFVDQESLTLQNGKSAKIRVDFDPSYKSDRISGIVNGKINVVHSDHPYRQSVELVGEVCFPNIKLDTNIINFGSILNDTTKKIMINMRNVSEMPLNYEWTFVEEEVIGEDEKMNSSNSLGNQSIPINQIFDILPLSGYLEPNQLEEVEFVYNALGGMNFRATAVCHVEGGPNYEVKLQGDSSLINAKISEKELDLGDQRFCEWTSRDIYIENTGKVTFEYKVITTPVKRKGFLDVTPLFGKIIGGQKQKLTIKICPVTPDAFKQQFYVQMGYFEPQLITVKGVGIYPSIVTNFPRIQNPQFDKKLKEDIDRYSKQYEAYLRRNTTVNKEKKDTKNSKKQMKTVQQYKMEVEKQLDRLIYCDLIKKQLSQEKSVNNVMNTTVESKLYEKLYLTTWVCDFGNVIVGSTQKKVIKIKNVGNLPIDMFFDTKLSKTLGYTLTPQKFTKMGPSEEINLSVTLTTKKTMKFGKTKISVPLQVKNGAQYKLELIANLTIPDILIQGNPENFIDFGKVLCGQRKIVYLKFLNQKEIQCEWSLNLRDSMIDKKEELKFTMNPSSGKIPSGGMQIVQISFSPSSEKQHNIKFPLKIVDNTKIFMLELKGVGTSISLDLKPSKLKIGPVLPYSNFSYEVIQITNPTNYSTQLTSLDFDRKFKQQEQLISMFEQIENSEKKQQNVYLPIRQPGTGVWPQVIKAVEKRKKKLELQKKLETEGDKLSQQQKDRINKQISNLSAVQQVVQYPKKVDSEVMQHLIIYGPPKSGKTTIAKTLNKEHKRAIININQILQWNINNGTTAGTKAKEFLEQRKKQYELALQQRQKLFKKAGKKAKQLQEKLGPVNEPLYQILPENIFVELIKERIRHPECNAGCIFDNLSSKNIPNETTATKLIMKAVGSEALQLLILEGKPPRKQEKEQQKQKQQKIEQQKKRKQSVRKDNKIDIVPQEKTEEAATITFQTKELEGEEKKAFEERKADLIKFFKNEHIKEITITLFKDPVFEEAKKDDKAMKGSKHPIQEKSFEAQIPKDPTLFQGNRDLTTMPIYQNSFDQKQGCLKIVPAPVYKDPLKEPVPEPVYHQIITKSQTKPFETKILKEFTIYTPKDHIRKQQKVQKKKQERKAATSTNLAKTKKQENKEELQIVNLPKKQYKQDELIKDQTRWIIPANSILTLIVRFFSKVVGNFDSNLTFDNTFGLKRLVCPISAKSDFPVISTIPKNLYWTVKKSRPTTAPQSYLSKAFVQSENIYDFGPLLIGKNPDKKNQKDILSVNSTTFRLSNQGSYPTELEFALLSSITQGNPEFKKGVFTISEEKLTLATTDTPKEIRVWALPDLAQKFRDELIIMIKNNPSPVIIPIQCLGAKPSIDIIEGSPLKFTRILLKQTTKKQLKLKNNSPIPIKFKLNNIEALPEEFTINIKQGQLKPTQQTTIEVTFKAIKQQKFSHKIFLVAQDLQGLNIKNQPKQIPIQAQAFDISVQLKFPGDNTQNLLDFGAIRVGDFKDQNFTVKNIGLYAVKFSFAMKKKLFKDSFRIEPSQVQLQPNNSKEILVRCTSNKQLKLKTNNNTTDINMQILEGKTLETHKSVPINVAVNAVYSKYSVIPLKNINFGPIQFNQSKTRTFEIKNEGLFDFNFALFDFNNEEFRKELQSNLEKEKQAKLEALNTLPIPGSIDPKKGKKEVKQVKKEPIKKGAKGGKGQPQNQLKIGQWIINPSSGNIPPDSSVTLEVIFAGSGQKLYQQKLGLDIQNRDPEDQPKGILYELVAQSCIPGINTQNFESIFEQQVVMASQNSGSNISTMINSNVYFVEEKVFHFGTLVPSKIPDGIVEKFKIQNNNKVPCVVKFDTRKKTPNSVEQFAFEVQPKNVKIPPHQHSYVNVTFKPTIMAMYSGIFEAIVQNGEQNPKTSKLLFDLRGQGALPTIKLEKPKEFLDERTVLVKFQKTRIGKTVNQQIILKNDGAIQATAKWDITASDAFRFLDQNSLTLNPKSYATFNIEFKPKDAGVKQWDLSVQTLLNQFEVTRFKIQGQGFFQEILFQNLPEQQQDKCNFGDCIINKQKKINFSIRNNGNSIIKFQWPYHDDFTFLPRIGHIEPKTNKLVTLTFKSTKTVTHKELVLNCQTNQIKQTASQFIDWDDSMFVNRWVTKTEFDWLERKKQEQKRRREEQAELAKKGAKKDNKKGSKIQLPKQQKQPIPPPGEQADIQIQELIPEPENIPIQKTEKTIALKASAVSDYARYQIESKIIRFSPTLMYTSRVHKFSIKNTSLINMKYTCKIVDSQTGKIDPGYYMITNHNGNIAPNCDESFTLKFSPTQVEDSNQRLLVVSIENLDPQQEKLIIELDGDTERPICYFELAPSKYREKKPDLEAKYNIIEFQSIGTKVKNSKRFYVVNPTAIAYEYQWKKIDNQKTPNSGFFRCPTSKGTILSGKKSEIIFEYTPDLVGTHESYWIFEIASEKITQHFLIVGNVNQPNVFFDSGKINFGPLLIGGKNKQVINLKNLQDVPLPFNFDRESIKGEPETGQSLKVQPISGIIPPQGDAKIQITFAPKIQKEFNYNLSCSVKRKSRAVCINVKGIGYVLSHSVYLNNSPQPLNSSDKHEIQFGNLFVNEKRIKTLTIQNNGDFNFDFAIKKNSSFSFLKLSNEFGTVKKNEKFAIQIQFAPTEQFNFVNSSSISLSIISGPTYTFFLKGSAKKPGVEFSFYSYDFGPCFVLKQPLPVTTYLEIRNRESTAMSIQPLYEKTAFLDVRIASGQVVLPLKVENVKDKKGVHQVIQTNVLKIPIVFTPREFIKYSQIVTFNINGLNKIDVELKGEGVPFKLEVEKTENQNIDFGITRVGEESSRVVSIVNLSKKKIDITFDCDKQLEEFAKLFLEISPNNQISINPKERKQIEISFHPMNRIHAFKTELNYKIVQNQQKRKLLNVQTTAHGIELKLMEQTIGFGTVVINSKVTKVVQLANLGDIGTKYQWDTTFCEKYFTITPRKGYLPAHQDLNFQITFHPNVADNDIRFKIKCNIEGSDPLFMNLLGKCIPMPKENIQEYKFDCIVRTSKSQKIQLKNPTAKIWKIKASISTENEGKNYFQGKEFIEVPANSQSDYEVIYTPLTMTANPEVKQIKEESHEATLFFPIPDGTAILCKLIGKSLAPLPLQTFDLVLKAKKNGYQMIPIKNWLKTAQRFNVSWKFQAQDKTIFVNAANTFDVAGQATKQYKLSIYALKNCQAKLEIFFKNPNTYEFISFKINLKVDLPDPMPKIEMISVVRESLTKLITIENPLPMQVEIKKQMLIVDSDVVFLQPNSFTIPAKSQFGFEVIYRPLLAKEQNAKITLKSPELGEFVYPLRLVGNPTTLQRTLGFKTNLGNDITQTFKFIHYGKKATVYNCRVEKLGQKVSTNIDPKAKQPIIANDFSVETATVNAVGAQTFEGVEVGVNIKFEPSSLNQSSSQLIVSSQDGGQYICILNGYGFPPQPKGPFKISGPKPPPIDFKNPFFDAIEFTVRIDNPAFTSGVKSPIKIDGKKVLSINLTYKAVPGYSNSGRLIISAGELPAWVFYLQGE